MKQKPAQMRAHRLYCFLQFVHSTLLFTPERELLFFKLFIECFSKVKHEKNILYFRNVWISICFYNILKWMDEFLTDIY